MDLIFKSKLYREEFKHWILILCLLVWASISTIFALQNKSRTVLIGIDEVGTRIITESSDRLLQSELKNFLKSFLDLYYTYNETNFSARMGQATEFLSLDLWNSNKSKLLELDEKLKKASLTQFSEVESIDLLEPGRIEAILNLRIRSRLSENKVRLKVLLDYKRASRTERNPWGFEITELSDATL